MLVHRQGLCESLQPTGLAELHLTFFWYVSIVLMQSGYSVRQLPACQDRLPCSCHRHFSPVFQYFSALGWHQNHVARHRSAWSLTCRGSWPDRKMVPRNRDHAGTGDKPGALAVRPGLLPDCRQAPGRCPMPRPAG